MKKFSIILNVVLILVTLFFVVYANIQTKLAKEQAARAHNLEKEYVALVEDAVQEAANARKAEANEKHALELLKECQESK